MDAKTIYGLVKPHLDTLDHVEKETLSNLILGLPPQKVSRHHRKVISLSKAKKKLKRFCRREMEREKKQNLHA